MKSKCPICNKKIKKCKRGKNKTSCYLECKRGKSKKAPKHLFLILNQKAPARFYLLIGDYLVSPYTTNPNKPSYFSIYKKRNKYGFFKKVSTCPEFEIKSIQQLINKLETIATFS